MTEIKKRFTISITDEIAIQLDRMKQAKYYNTSQNKMVQDLIRIGLETMQKELESVNREETSYAPGAEP